MFSSRNRVALLKCSYVPRYQSRLALETVRISIQPAAKSLQKTISSDSPAVDTLLHLTGPEVT